MKLIIGAMVAAIALVAGSLLFSRGDNQSYENNVAVVDGVQVVTIYAKGGYAPRQTMASANLPTVFNVITQGTFDCSGALTIPALGYRANLPMSGETRIPVPAQTPGTTMRGVCAMGMYSFSVAFQ